MNIRRLASALLVAFAATSSVFAATNPHITAHPQARITQKVDVRSVTPLLKSHPAIVEKLADAGRVSSNVTLHGLTIVLRSSDDQEFQLQSLLDTQQDKTNANYHQWMTPESFGDAFGIDSSDLAKISDWLQSSGLTIDSVAKSKRLIRFSGSVARIEAAFGTEMHQYTVNGETRVSNATDISIPRAFSPVISGVAMNNFRPKSNLIRKGLVSRGSDGQLHPVTGIESHPDVTLGGGNHYVGGGDLQYLYDSAPLLASGNDGTGVKIGIIGRTDVLLSDIQTYRTAFGLKPNNPNIIVVGQDPGTQNGDDGESALDLEVSGAIAPGATIDFYTSASDEYEISGTFASALYVIENNSDDIISLSYGAAEDYFGSFNYVFESLWEQAAAQGISVFVSTGDSGPDTYDDGDPYAATRGEQYSVNAFASTPYNVAVGGTMFNEGTGTGYWAATNTMPGNISALGYIPEQPWDESAIGSIDTYFGGIVAASSGISFYYGLPAWQTGPGISGVTDPTPIKGTVTGFSVPGPHRLLPDVSMEAAGGHDGFLTCSEGACIVGNDGTLGNADVVGGTSIATPSWAGVQALINQKNGGRQGNPNYYYYKLAAAQNTTTCAATALSLTTSNACSFHDIQVGNTDIRSTSSGTVANGNYVGWAAGPGYDVAVGLGSPDINVLAGNWKNVKFTATSTTLTLSPTTTPTADTAVNYTITVAPTSGSGTPTGDVSIIAQTTPNGGVGYVTLSGGQASGTIPDSVNFTLAALPAGTYKVYAHYAGDTTFGGSNSAPVTVTIGQINSQLTITSESLNASTLALTQTTNFTYGQNIYFDTDVCDPSGNYNYWTACSTGYPTGTVTYSLTGGPSAEPSLSVPLNSTGNAFLLSGFGVSGNEIMPNYPVLPGGTYTVNAAYSGDTTYKSASATPFTITIGPGATTLTLTANTATISSGGTAVINAATTTITQSGAALTPNGAVPPTGTITFTDSTTTSTLGTCTLANGVCSFSTTAITTNGAHTITASFAPADGNYAAATASKTITITVGGATAPTPTISYKVGSTVVTGSTVGQTVAITAAVASPATGTVTFYDGGVQLGTAALSASAHTASLSVGTFTAGAHQITAVYSGNATLQNSTSAVTPLVVAPNSPTISLQSTGQAAVGATISMQASIFPTPTNQKKSSNVWSAMNPAPTGTVTYFDNGTSIGTAPLLFHAATLSGEYLSQFNDTKLTPGVHTLTAQYTGDANYNATAVSNGGTYSIGLTTVAITAPSTVGAGTTFPVTATITPLVANTAAIGGTVTFLQGTTVLGTATVTKGVATLVVGPQAATTATGSATITANYSGDANYYKSTATTTLTYTTVTPSFSISLNPNAITVKQGFFATSTLSATVTGFYQSSTTVSCSGLPANSRCSTLPNLTFDGSGTPTSTTFYIVTQAAPSPKHAGLSNGLLWIPAMFFAGFLIVRRRQLSARGRQVITLTVLLCATMATIGCGNNSSSASSSATPIGTSNVTLTVSATGAGGSPTASATTTFTLNVTQ